MEKSRVNKFALITRRFDAPRELVLSAISDPEHLMRWFAPKGCKMVYCKLDLRPGGIIHYCAQSSEGDLVWGSLDMLNKATLMEEDGETILKLTTNEPGYYEVLDQLEIYLLIITEKIIQHEYR